jgi:thiol-disulfide isomerase/thioredoxin
LFGVCHGREGADKKYAYMGFVKTLIFGVLVFAALAGSGQALPPQPPSPAKMIPEFRWERHDHRFLANADLPKGKLILIVFFDPDCEHCRHTVQRMDQQYASFSGAAVYFVSMASQDKIDWFAAAYAPRLFAQKNVVFLRDSNGGYMLGFHPTRYPSLFLYSPGNKLLDYEDSEETLFRIEKSIAANTK